MSTLKTTLKVESTDLFPTPVSFTQVNNNSVNGTFSGFNQVVCGTVGIASTLNIASITSPCYLYLQAPTTNGTAIWIAEGTTGVVFAQLAPGDITFMSYGQDAYPAADIQAYTPGSTATLNYFIGEKA
jgi:hypothetical protein